MYIWPDDSKYSIVVTVYYLKNIGVELLKGGSFTFSQTCTNHFVMLCNQNSSACVRMYNTYVNRLISVVPV